MLSARGPQNNAIGELSGMRRMHDLNHVMIIVHRSTSDVAPEGRYPGQAMRDCGGGTFAATSSDAASPALPYFSR
jgi:hypothetical protein